MFGGPAVPAILTVPAIPAVPAVATIPALQPFFRTCKISHSGTKIHLCCMGWGCPCPHRSPGQVPDGAAAAVAPGTACSHPMSPLSLGLGLDTECQELGWWHRGPQCAPSWQAPPSPLRTGAPSRPNRQPSSQWGCVGAPSAGWDLGQDPLPGLLANHPAPPPSPRCHLPPAQHPFGSPLPPPRLPKAS